MTPDSTDLLHELRPWLRMDSRDRWRPGSAELLTKPGVLVVQGYTTVAPSLVDLAPQVYADGALATSRDYLSTVPRGLRRHVDRLRSEMPEPRDLVYGHVVEEHPGVVWLQWWMAYPRNDTPMTLGRGSHHADWERLAVRLLDGKPDLAVGSQHRAGEVRAWADVELDDGRPVVYPRWGTHAVAFEPGWKWLGGSFDVCNGRRVIDPAVEVLGPSTPWRDWPGLWGDVKTGHVIRGPLSHRTPALLAAAAAKTS